jgi:3-phenylpropionate/trans-cinnamate dioxygenase ferredoxin subunit
MNNWIDAGRDGSLADGEYITLEIDDQPVALFRVEGDYYAIRDTCTHDGAEIASGRLEGCNIVCPRHGAKFCLKTGAVLSPPAYENVETYDVRTFEGRLQIREKP